jgi:hypothetical protein
MEALPAVKAVTYLTTTLTDAETPTPTSVTYTTTPRKELYSEPTSTETSEEVKKGEREKRTKVLWIVLPLLLAIPFAWFCYTSYPALIVFLIWVEAKWLALKAKRAGRGGEMKQDVEGARVTPRT